VFRHLVFSETRNLVPLVKRKLSVSHVIGIDIGSAGSKGVIIRDTARVAGFDCPSSGDLKGIAETVRKELLSIAGLSKGDIDYILVTGYGSKQVPFASETRSDISCHGRGVHFYFPSVRTIVDVGDLNSKVMRIDEHGHILKFLSSGKCAGGSGRVLKVIAKILQMRVEDIGALSMKSEKPVDFNTGCAVFAESEAVSRIADGTPKEDLLAGIHRALASQLKGLAERLGIEKEVALVGGGGRDAGLLKAFGDITGLEIRVPPEPHMTAALGAGLLAWERISS
jgi:predicted CoA-substrate-specific enzyme activase